MDALPVAVAAAVKFALDRIAKRFDAGAKRGSQIPEASIATALENHLAFVDDWSASISMLDHPEPFDIAGRSIALNITSVPRRFRGTRGEGEDSSPTLTEVDLLRLRHHVLLLGDPGSGKTTTLKRLARTLLLEPPSGPEDSTDYPMVVELGSLPSAAPEDQRVHAALAVALGIPYEAVRVKGSSGEPESTALRLRTDDLDSAPRIDGVVAEVIRDTKPLLILDGMDEAFNTPRSVLAREIAQLGHRIAPAKIIVSSRTGDYSVTMQGFQAVELCPLSEAQIFEISRKCLPDADRFLEALREQPFADVSDRPLMLMHLLFLYQRDGTISDQPSDVYGKVVRQLLVEWDRERGMQRRSKYAEFDEDRKAMFLGALSFYLTYRLDRTKFTERDLVSAYTAIHHRFRLPSAEALDVARELETHTGIIRRASHNELEFAHLSLQEYLCATHIIKSAIPAELPPEFPRYAHPLAIATALSTEPSAWLSRLVLTGRTLEALTAEAVLAFIGRLVVERPRLDVSEALGFATLVLLDRVPRQAPNLLEVIERLLSLAHIVPSLALALRWYSIDRLTLADNDVRAELLPHFLRAASGVLLARFGTEPPAEAWFPRTALDLLADNAGHTETWLSSPGAEPERCTWTTIKTVKTGPIG